MELAATVVQPVVLLLVQTEQEALEVLVVLAQTLILVDFWEVTTQQLLQIRMLSEFLLHQKLLAVLVDRVALLEQEEQEVQQARVVQLVHPLQFNMPEG